jgi:hypothetical protein
VGIGIRMRTLWRLRGGMILCLALSLLAAVWSVQKISLFPPSLTPRSLEMATASTSVVIDTPTSALVDLRQDTYSLDGLTNRAVLLGNVISSTTVRQHIARRAGLPVERLTIQAPLTPKQSAPRADSENRRTTGDIVKSTDHYRLNIQSNPSVPVLDIYAQTPNAESAAILVNSAVEELQAYLVDLARAEKTPPHKQITLIQLGKARGTVINEGVDWQIAILAFLITFGISSATVIFAARVRAGWRLAAAAESA